MAYIQIAFACTVTTLPFADDELAQAAYEKISAALKEYQRFKNDRAETVDVETRDGPATLKLERMDTVTLSRTTFESAMRIALEEEKTARAMRSEMGLPDLRKATSADA